MKLSFTTLACGLLLAGAPQISALSNDLIGSRWAAVEGAASDRAAVGPWSAYLGVLHCDGHSS